MRAPDDPTTAEVSPAGEKSTPPERLPAYTPTPIAPHSAKPGANRLWWIVGGVVLVVVVLSLAAAALIVSDLLARTVAEQAPTVVTDEVDIDAVRAMVAEEYPGYTVRQQDIVQDYLASGLPAVRMIVEKDSAPGFYLALEVVKPGDQVSEFLEFGMAGVGDYLLNDSVFNQSSIRRRALEQDDIDEIIAEYLKIKPGEHALVVFASQFDTYVILDVDGNATLSDGHFTSNYYPTHVVDADQMYDRNDASYMDVNVYDLESWTDMVEQAQ